MADKLSNIVKEQDENLKRFYLSKKERDTESRWSADGPSSISPFVPCAAGRIPFVLRAARLTAQDVLWDLGCGDGRVLHQAAAQYGCHVVGVDIDAPCILEARERATDQQIDHLCQFTTCDLTALEAGALHPDADGRCNLGAASLGEPLSAALRAPTCVLIFITSHGLTRLQDFLHGEWALGGLRIVTCVESLASCFDFEAEDALFGCEQQRHEWPVYAGHEPAGVYVVPPLGVATDEWAQDEARMLPARVPTPAEADGAAVALLRGMLRPDDIAALNALGAECSHVAAEVRGEVSGEVRGAVSGELKGGGSGEVSGGAAVSSEEAFSEAGFDLFTAGDCETDIISAAEDALHAAREHRVVHLHRDGAVQTAMPRLLERVLNRIRQADAEAWRLLLGRPVNIRSAELHIYQVGGAVNSPEHRDTGSLLTLSVLLSEPCEYSGAEFLWMKADAEDGGSWKALQGLSRGDGVLFPSEKRHNVTPLLSGERRSFVIELWEGAANTHNRHR